MKYVDFQFHSYYSDGFLSPKEIVDKLAKENFSVASLTDHNTIAGLEEFGKMAKKKNIKAIPGVEIYSRFRNQELHLLGYGMDLKNQPLLKFLKESQEKHLKWFYRTLNRLAKLGFKIDFEAPEKSKSKYLGFLELQNILLKYPENKRKILKESRSEKIELFKIINSFFIKGKTSYVKGIHLDISTAEVIKLIKKAGGITVLAHPGQQLSFKKSALVIKKLKKEGLVGLEAISGHHNWHQIAFYQKLAEELNLAVSAGSDCHGFIVSENGSLKIQTQWDYFKPPYSLYENLKKYLK